jgi:hypothetical protein
MNTRRQMGIVLKMQRTTNQGNITLIHPSQNKYHQVNSHGQQNIQIEYLINLLYNIKQLLSRSTTARPSSSQNITPTKWTMDKVVRIHDAC